MQLSILEPAWLDNYAPGYIGFQYDVDGLTGELDAGIAYFTRWDRLSSIKVAHTFVVSSQFECVEAIGSGVQVSPLLPRFKDPTIAVFFRKPRYYSLDLGCAISRAARAQIGAPYDRRLIAGQALVNGWLPHLLLPECAEIKVLSWFRTPGAFVCCGLAAYAMQPQTELHNLGCLRRPFWSINPQLLFEDDQVFEPWKSQAGPSSSLQPLNREPIRP